MCTYLISLCSACPLVYRHRQGIGNGLRITEIGSVQHLSILQGRCHSLPVRGGSHISGQLTSSLPPRALGWCRWSRRRWSVGPIQPPVSPRASLRPASVRVQRCSTACRCGETRPPTGRTTGPPGGYARESRSITLLDARPIYFPSLVPKVVPNAPKMGFTRAFRVSKPVETAGNRLKRRNNALISTFGQKKRPAQAGRHGQTGDTGQF